MGERAAIFPEQEFRDRLSRLQSALNVNGIDAILLTTPADIFYVSGFLTRFWESPARPWFILVPAIGRPVAIIPSIGEHLMQQSWIGDIRTWDAPNPEDDGVSVLIDAIMGNVPKDGVLGLPMGLETHLRMPLADFNRVIAAIRPRRIADATTALQRTREVKSTAEIEKIRSICQIGAAAFAKVSEIAQPGKPLDAIFREFQAQLLGAGADWVSYLAGAAGQEGYVDVISPATNTPLLQGDILMLDTGAVKDGYFCDFNRNFFLGTPSADVLRVQEALWNATERALEALRPGMLASDAHRLLHDALRHNDVRPCRGRFGHGLGLTLTEWPSFTPLDQTELRSGMVLTLEPSAFTTEGRFLVHEENIVLREHGAELLTPRAQRLEVL